MEGLLVTIGLAPVLIAIRIAAYIVERLIRAESISLGALWRTVTANVFNICSKTKLIFEVVLFISLFCIFFHRLLGWLAAAYLTHLIGTKEGAFHFGCRCIALRLGLDENDIVIRDFIFKNPPGFRNDNFVKVQCMTIAFDLRSVYDAIFHGKQIIIHHLELAGVDVHIEKGSEGAGLNLWSCLGATNDEQAKEVENSVHANISVALKATADATVMVVDAVAKYNPASLLYKGIKSGAIQKNINSITANKLHVFDGLTSSRKSSRSASLQDDMLSCAELIDGDYNEHEHDHDPSHDEDLSPKENISHRGSKRYFQSFKNLLDTSSHEKDLDEKAKEEGNGHWGVPYTLDVKEVTLRDVNIYAQDFVSVEHDASSDLKSHAIRFKLMNMSRKELTNHLSKSTKRQMQLQEKDYSSMREPIYFDELVWRVIGKAINEVFANNKLAVTKILAHAAFSHTASLAAHVLSGQMVVEGASAVAGAAFGGGKAVVDGASGVVLGGASAVAEAAFGGGKAVVDGASGVVIGGSKAVVEGANIVGEAVFGGSKAVVGKASELVKGVGHCIVDLPHTSLKKKSVRLSTPVVSESSRSANDSVSDAEVDTTAEESPDRSYSKSSEGGWHRHSFSEAIISNPTIQQEKLGVKIVQALKIQNLLVRVYNGQNICLENKPLHRPCSVKFHLETVGKKGKLSRISTTHVKYNETNGYVWDEVHTVTISSLSQRLHMRIYAHYFMSKSLVSEFVIDLCEGLNLRLSEFVGSSTDGRNLSNRRRSFDSMLRPQEEFPSLDDNSVESAKIVRPLQPSVGAYIGLEHEIISEYSLSDSPWVKRGHGAEHGSHGTLKIGLKLG